MTHLESTNAAAPRAVFAATRWPSWAWAVLAACLATVPFAAGLTGSRIFYIRDLSISFWGRYLWLRRTVLSGEWPLWDPYVGGGQPALADALHQMFLLPALLVRLLGTEVQGFNFWVALPFPLAALGAFGFFNRRFSVSASTLAAIAFSVSGPVVSTGNFPNMSWSVAALPGVLWAVDCVVSGASRRNVAALALAVAFQALAGEPVTFFTTLVLAVAYGVTFAPLAREQPLGRRLRPLVFMFAGLGLGLALASIQLVPMVLAATAAERSKNIALGVWSLHPLALLEMVALRLFGDYYVSQSVAQLPWMTALNSGREPFFFSLYFGVPLLALASFGLIAGGVRRWSLFWTLAAAASLIGAFGIYTPIYPFLRTHLPLLGSFRFPVKYLVVVAVAIAAGAASGWDLVTRRETVDVSERRRARARVAAVGLALFVGTTAYAIAGACIYFATPAIFRLFALAKWLHTDNPVAAAEFMLRALPRIATTLMLLSVAAAGLLFLASGRRKEAPAARYALYLLIAGDLLVRAWGINPVFDPGFLSAPQWLPHVADNVNYRFYIGGKQEGTLDATDVDSSRAFLNPPGLTGSASRAALSAQAAFYPSAWKAREMLSFDLAVLWPQEFQQLTTRFRESGPEARDRFLDRTGVRYRALPARRASGRQPLIQVPYFLESSIHDWGSGVTPRASVVSEARTTPGFERQLDLLFQDGWDSRVTAIVDHEPVASGAPGVPQSPSARLVADRPTRVVVEASAGSGGGYLILLDSFSTDWQATVDGMPAAIVRANAWFRGVRLTPGPHTVDFVYRPRAFLWGASLSAVSAVILLALLFLGRTSRQNRTAATSVELVRT